MAPKIVPHYEISDDGVTWHTRYGLVTGGEINQACSNLIQVYPDEDFVDVLEIMYRILGLSSRQRRNWLDLTQEQAAKVKNMAGPHGYAYCKAMIARNQS